MGSQMAIEIGVKYIMRSIEMDLNVMDQDQSCHQHDFYNILYLQHIHQAWANTFS